LREQGDVGKEQDYSPKLDLGVIQNVERDRKDSWKKKKKTSRIILRPSLPFGKKKKS